MVPVDRGCWGVAAAPAARRSERGLSEGAGGTSSKPCMRSAAEPCSPVRIRITSAMGTMKILPSPTSPVWAAVMMMSTTSFTCEPTTTTSTFVFSIRFVEASYSLPWYRSLPRPAARG